MSEHDQGAAYKDCQECDGVGYFENVIGEHQPGLGGIEPIIRTTRCKDCGGDGFVERERDEMAEEIERLTRERDYKDRQWEDEALRAREAEAQRDKLLDCLKDMVKYYPCGHAPPDRCCCVCASYAAIARCEP